MYQKNKPYILILPALLTSFILIIGGLISGFTGSLGLSYNDAKSISFKFYKKVLYSKDFWKSTFLTIKISVISTLIASLLALLIVFLLFNLKVKHKKTTMLWRILQIPMLFSYLISAYAIFLMLSQSGFLSSISYKLGFLKNMSTFPAIVNDKYSIGIITAYVWKTTPFIVLMLYPILLNIDTNWLNAAKTLGSTNFQFFKKIVFPMLKNDLFVSQFIIFCFSFSAFEVPYLLGMSYPKALGVFSYELYTNGDFSQRPFALAINMLMFIFIMIIAGTYYYFYNKKLNCKEKNYDE